MRVAVATGPFWNRSTKHCELMDPLENPFLKIALDTYHVGFQDHEDSELVIESAGFDPSSNRHRARG